MSTTGKKNIKNANIVRLNSTHLNNLQAREDIKEEIKICIETNENTKTKTQMGFSENSAKKKVHSNTSLPQETRETSNTLTLHLKQLEKRRQVEPQSQ